ncbi:MAG: TetR/AcrR family transcriptional regulator [Proteobacteria bacterium]|nr:TetR/AcrR family transcriptional regulator [Pseudomonadota bacterium]
MKGNIVDKTKDKYLEYQRRHQEILDAAIKLFNSKGYVATTTARIAKNAHVTERTIYGHFKNKQDLFMECVYSIIGKLLETWHKELEKNKKDDIGYIKAIAVSYVDFVINNPDKSMFLVHIFSYRVFPEFDDLVTKFLEGMIQSAEDAIDTMKAKGVSKSQMNSRMLAGMFISQYFSMVFVNEYVGKDFLTAETVVQMSKDLMKID